MKTKYLLSIFVLLVLVLAACSGNGEAPPPVEVTRVVEVVVTATPVPTETPAPTPAPQLTPTPAPVPTPEPVDPAVVALIETFPQELSEVFGEDSRDLGLVTAPSNDDWAWPLSPTTLWPIDEDGGVVSWSTGYAWITIGQVNDSGPIWRFAGPWGGNHVVEVGGHVRANYTYFIVATNHTTDVGAFQLAGDHYPAGSVAVSSGHPTPVQFAEALQTAVSHTSGTNDEVNPAPRVGIFLVNAENGKVVYLQVDYLGDDSWEWFPAQHGQLPLVDSWGTMHSVFDVLEN